jgi:hypothetical protein
VTTPDRLAVERDTAADAGADDDAEYHLQARGRAVRGLGDGEAVGVVRQPHLAP